MPATRSDQSDRSDPSDPSDPSLRSLISSRLPATLEILREWVGINSHTANREGVLQLGRHTAQQFAPLGFRAEFVPHKDSALGDHLILSRAGRGAATIAMVSHLDTVFPPEEEIANDFRWQPEGDRIFGPGTIDIKGGTAMIHLVLSSLAEWDRQAFEETNWLVLLNSSEETLSAHFAEICRERLDPGTRAALVFESEGRVEGRPALVVARKGRATFRISVEGRGAHAGVKHARGANAITQLARVVSRIAEFTDYRRDLTFNVGVIRGGVAVNRVPHMASAELELRTFSPEAYKDGVRAVLDLAGEGDVRSPADGHPCVIRVERLTESPAWPRNEGTDRLFKIWRQAADTLGQPLEAQQRGGLSDGNWIHQWVPTIDGLGPHGDNDHCSERSADGSKLPEFIWVPSIIPKALLNVTALRALIRG